MKHWILTCLLIIWSLSSHCQNIDLSGMMGLKNTKGEIMLELSGYDIFIKSLKGNINNEKTLKSIKKDFKLENILTEYSEVSLNIDNKIIEAEFVAKEKPNAKVSQVCYLLTNSDKDASAILFQTLNQRDVILEQEIVKTFLDNGLADYIVTNNIADSINFAGRNIELGTACRWMSPHNIHCKGGQISWSEFPSFESAMLDINARIKANVDEENIPILKEEDIDVVFEDIPSIAHRVVYKRKSSYSYQNPLIVYYIVQEVRGRFLSTTLSNYGYNRDDYELAPLLQQIISIPELPDNAYNQFDVSKFEEVTEEEKEAYKDYINFWEIRAGTWIPIGSHRNIFKIAPSVGIHIGLPIRKDMTIDLGFQAAFPIKAQLFNFYYDDKTYSTKTDFLAGINVRWRYQQKLAKNIYWTTYIGFGLMTAQTDLEKENYENDSDKYHYVETFDVFGGINIRYKKVGFFVEYHYTPYSIAGKVNKNFGYNAANMGLVFAF